MGGLCYTYTCLAEESQVHPLTAQQLELNTQNCSL